MIGSLRLAVPTSLLATMLVGHPTIAAPTYDFVNFDLPSAIGNTNATGINNAGQVVGSTTIISGTSGYVRAADGSFTLLNVPNSPSTSAAAINDAGQVVGTFYRPPTGFVGPGSGIFTSPGYLYDPASGTYAALYQTLNYGTNTIPRGINDAGQIVGDYVGYFYTVQAFVRAADGSYSNIADPDTFDFTQSFTGLPVPHYATGINNAGQIVGYYSVIATQTSGTAYYGYRYDPTTNTFTTLNDPLATEGTFPSAINDSGQIVGSYQTALAHNEGFLYDPATNTYTTITDPAEIGGFGTYANGINDAGQIAGTYRDLAGTHAFLASPEQATAVPEPSSLLLLVPFSLLLLRRRPAQADGPISRRQKPSGQTTRSTAS